MADRKPDSLKIREAIDREAVPPVWLWTGPEDFLKEELFERLAGKLVGEDLAALNVNRYRGGHDPIEEVVNTHPSVQASAVIGLQDPSRGEVPIAFVELVEGAEFDEPSIRSHCRKSLAQYKVPRDVRMLDALPRNPTGKIMRRELSPDTPCMAAKAEA